MRPVGHGPRITFLLPCRSMCTPPAHRVLGPADPRSCLPSRLNSNRYASHCVPFTSVRALVQNGCSARTTQVGTRAVLEQFAFAPTRSGTAATPSISQHDLAP